MNARVSRISLSVGGTKGTQCPEPRSRCPLSNTHTQNSHRTLPPSWEIHSPSLWAVSMAETHTKTQTQMPRKRGQLRFWLREGAWRRWIAQTPLTHTHTLPQCPHTHFHSDKALRAIRLSDNTHRYDMFIVLGIFNRMVADHNVVCYMTECCSIMWATTPSAINNDGLEMNEGIFHQLPA